MKSPVARPSAAPREAPWKSSPHRVELLRIYAEIDALLEPFSCEGSTECCRFGITGREPYPTAVEVAEVEHAIAALGGLGQRREKNPRLPLVDEDERRCPLLSAEGRCRIYKSRPFGCRTFFCDRISGPSRWPRNEVQRVSRAIADLSARFQPRDPHPRPLTPPLRR